MTGWWEEYNTSYKNYGLTLKMSKLELIIQLTKLVFGVVGLGLLIFISLKIWRRLFPKRITSS